jgi:cytoskeletal protein RodZ
MKIANTNNHRRKRVALISAIIVVLFLLCGGALAYFRHIGPFEKKDTGSTTNLNPPTEEQKKAGLEIKDSSDSSSTPKQGGVDQPPAPTPQPGTSKREVDMTITAANQNGSTLQIRTLISALVNTGTCTLTLTSPSGSLVTKSSGVQPQSNTSTCKGFDVSTTELSSGDWKATVIYDSDTLTGSASTTVSIKI